MSRTYDCPFCSGGSATSINTYKHVWVSCDTCGNIVRAQKATYPLEVVPDGVFRVLPKGRGLSQTLKRKKQGEAFYDYYLDASEGQSASAAGTKWEGEAAAIRRELETIGVDVRGKRVLDISGGPGFLAQELSTVCDRVVVTEFSRVAAERMSQVLGVDAVRYDFNSDDIGDIVEGPFDVILIRYAINFCLDIRRMLASLKPLLSREAVVYVSFVAPTLGTCLRWQFDDYTYLVLYHPETIARLFAEEGFTAFARYAHESYDYRAGLPRRITALMAPARVANRAREVNRELVQKGLVSVFRRNPAACW